jgi:hypothetical protein
VRSTIPVFVLYKYKGDTMAERTCCRCRFCASAGRCGSESCARRIFSIRTICAATQRLSWTLASSLVRPSAVGLCLDGDSDGPVAETVIVDVVDIVAAKHGHGVGDGCFDFVFVEEHDVVYDLPAAGHVV